VGGKRARQSNRVTSADFSCVLCSLVLAPLSMCNSFPSYERFLGMSSFTLHFENQDLEVIKALKQLKMQTG